MGARSQTLDERRRQVIRSAGRADLGVQQAEEPFRCRRRQERRDIDRRRRGRRTERRQELDGEVACGIIRNGDCTSLYGATTSAM